MIKRSQIGLTFKFLALALAANAIALSFARASAAVTISSFSAQAQTSTILVKWTTGSEIGNAGFNIYRSTSPSGTFTKINASLIPPQNPGDVAGANYTYEDTGLTKGTTFYYKLEAVENSGSKQQFGPVNAQVSVPTATSTPAAPTATRTPTTVATTIATATATQIPGTATPTVYSSPTPFGTPPPTETSFPTRVAFVVTQPTVASAPPQSNVRGNASKPVVSPVPSNPDSNATQNSQTGSIQNSAPTSDSSNEDEPLAPVPTTSSKPNPLAFGFLALAGLFAITSLTLGATALYFLARKYIR